MKIQLSDHFDYKRLLRFTLPSIAMMIFSSIYGVVDGFFVSNYVGKTPFAAVNFIMPVIMIAATPGFMFGTGGGALVAKNLGMGEEERARKLFSLFVAATAVTGTVIAVAAIVFLPQISQLLGAEGLLWEYSIVYGRIILSTLPFFSLQMAFQSFFITAEKPQLGLYSTLATGVTNMVLDALFMAVFRWGIAGAAAATAISMLVGGVIPLVYFMRPNDSIMKLVKPSMDSRALLKGCVNGSSELMSNVSMSLVGMLYNIQLLHYAGENGVAAYGVLMYVNMIFIAVFIGYSVGIAPVIGYHFGAENKDELKSLKNKSFVIIALSSVAMVAVAEILAQPLSGIFVSYDEQLMAMTVRAFRFYSFSFLFAGMAIFGSSFFTALNNGLVSAFISFLRTLVFQIAAVILLPLVLGLDGIWISVVVAELAAAALSLGFIKRKQSYYGY